MVEKADKIETLQELLDIKDKLVTLKLKDGTERKLSLLALRKERK